MAFDRLRIALLALALAAGLGSARGWCAPAFPVPSTISPEAAAGLTRLMSLVKPGAGAAPVTAADWRARYLAGEKMRAFFLGPTLAKLKPATDAETLGGVAVLRVMASFHRDSSARVLIYVHGGGYTMFSAHSTLAAADPMLSMGELKASADAYAAPADQKNPYVSPVYGDYAKGFPPTMIQGGTREIFLSNFVRQYRAIDQAGGVAVLDLYEGMPHVFQTMLADSPESHLALAKAASFWRQHLASH